MEYKIGIIASDIEMLSELKALYPEETASGQYILELLDINNIEAQGQALVKAGAELIIGRSGGYHENAGIESVPVLHLKVSTGDLISALRKAMYKAQTIELFLWDKIDVDTELFDLIQADVHVHTFSYADQIEKVFDSVIGDAFEGVIVGGGGICALARKQNLPYVFVSPSRTSIEDLINYGKQILQNTHEVNYKNELLTTVVQGSHNALIAINEEKTIFLFNDRARDILKISSQYVMGRKIDDVFPELAFFIKDLESKSETEGYLVHHKEMVLTINTSLIQLEAEVKGMLFSFQDITGLQRMEQKIRRELSDRGLVAKYTFDDIISEDKGMQTVIDRAKKVGQSQLTAIIYGESGTGKELMASSLHNISPRRSAPFVAVNCAALTESLLESELFGYEEGAFTGARKGGKAGLFELAHGGTIFLDEINSMPLSLQAKILRVVEQKDVMRIGSDRIIPLDVRIICASNEDLKGMAEVNRFRKDLFYRLCSLEIHLPPLRERPKDIYPLFKAFLRAVVPDSQIRWPNASEIQTLESYDWPGNIRELKNVSERYLYFDEVDLPEAEIDDISTPKSLEHHNIDLKEIHKMVESRIINQLLHNGMNRTQVAETLGISRTALWKKMQDS